MQPVSDLMQLALQLRAISRDDGSIDAAQIRLIGLEEIRSAAGDKWPRMRERVREGSLQILSRFTSGEDVIVPAGDGFLVILAQGAAGANQERCRAMREALISFYLGEEALQTLRAEVTSRSLSADGFADLITCGFALEPGLPAKDGLLRDDITEARVYSLRERRVVMSCVFPTVSGGSGRRLAYDRDYILDGVHREHDFLSFDLAILDYAQRRAGEFVESAPIGFSVHATTLQTRRLRECYLGALIRSSGDFRSHALITIAEVERGTPLISMSEWCATLRGLGMRVALDLHYSDHAISSIGASGAWAAGFHLPIFSGAQKGVRSQRTLDQIRFWSRSLHAQGMRLIVHGFQDAEFVEAAGSAGADIATSEMLWRATEPAADLDGTRAFEPA